MIYRHRVW